MHIVYCDVETQKLLSDFPLLKGKEDRSQIKHLGISVAGTLWNGVYTTFDTDHIDNLLDYLRLADVIVGHNILWFDYTVIGGYFPYPEAKLGTNEAGIISRTFDTMLQFTNKMDIDTNTRSSWLGVDDIAKLNFGLEKPHDGRLIPQMWKDGKHDEVKSYLLNDLKMTEAFYLAGCRGTIIKYDHRVYDAHINKPASRGIKEIFLKW